LYSAEAVKSEGEGADQDNQGKEDKDNTWASSEPGQKSRSRIFAWRLPSEGLERHARDVR
jgi:hypothetical protein